MGSLSRKGYNFLLPMALGREVDRFCHQKRMINLNGRSILSETSKSEIVYHNSLIYRIPRNVVPKESFFGAARVIFD